MMRWLGVVSLVLLGAASALAAEPFTLKDGDRVVFLGNTLIEREQRYGYWETALARRYPGRKIVFRNLGWSGDTVFGISRARFGSTAEGFRHLREHVLALKPTVIVLGYGTNEAFEGPDGLKRFTDGCTALLAALAPAQARIVWLSPLRQEKLPAPLPEPTEQNKNLRLYSEALRELADKHNQTFVDLFTLLGPEGAFHSDRLLTDNGIHLTAQGYWHAASALEKGLGLPTLPPCLLELALDGTVVKSQGCRVKRLDNRTMRYEVTDDYLPRPPAPEQTDMLSDRIVKIAGLLPGKHALAIDGRDVATADAAQWAGGVPIVRGPEIDQVEQLRKTIQAKNLLYFHRWRPQNETYLFGFRKHEQGQNAREIPQFDPLVEKEELEILKLSSPRPHTYEIKPGADR